MSGETMLSPDEFSDAIVDIKHSAFRAEIQPRYLVSEEDGHYQSFLAGTAVLPIEVPYFMRWWADVARLCQVGCHIGRVRVFADPPTRYQQYSQWCCPWNAEAGEEISRMTADRAAELGLLDQPNVDWWLLDESRLIRMHHDTEHRPVRYTMTSNPAAIAAAARWRDIAVANSVLDYPASDGAHFLRGAEGHT